MQITNTMDLGNLNERAQNALTASELETLRDLLNATEYENTEDVPEDEWLKMLEAASN